ncbi:sensor histidine kinase [Dactylosporangium vinaceum]|uniref:histidine kinase n=1 Tax=Dactylosporangium vinaceum TaxID=53362 RepID=A0ABV5MH87_9ACTN|nr:histidine kinase [Dactylosporangium vinaceum]UAB94837.1 sensor histidine kinase [Dactylosporangium vinaceum]
MSARNAAVDVVSTVIAVSLALMVVAAGLEAGTLGDGRLLFSLAVTVPAIVLMWWRRRYPVGVAVAMLVPAALTDMVGGVVLIVLFGLAIRRPLRTVLWLAAAHVVVVMPFTILYPDPDLQVVGSATVGLALFAVVIAWGTAIRARRELIATLRERAVRAESEARQRAELLRGLERERIAREMHDVLAHRISLISLHAGALEIRRDLSREQVADAGKTIRASAHQAMEELREILGVLRASDREDLRPRQGLVDLAELVEEARNAGATVHLQNFVDDPSTLPAAADRTAFRLVQEGLTNARKHAPGTAVSVLLEHKEELHVRISNPLPARPVAPSLPGTRSGLEGLAERVALAGGRFEHGVRRDDGNRPCFTLEAWLP